MRIRARRWLAGGLMTFLAAAGCYSSIAPTPKLDPGTADTGLPIGPPPSDACASRRPWEGPGVTGLLPVSANEGLVLSGDRYFTAEFDTSAADASAPSYGRVTAWHETGLVANLWPTAPPVQGQEPWDDPGVTAAYIAKGGGAQVIVSRYRRWAHDGTQWAAGTVVEDFVINDAGPPSLDGAVPWAGVGVTATYFRPGENSFVVLSQNKGWSRTTTDPDPQNWTWSNGFNIAETAPYSSAPPVGGVRPWDGKGVTAAYYVGTKYVMVSVDKMWIYAGSAWTAGMVKDMPGWGSAPPAGCN